MSESGAIGHVEFIMKETKKEYQQPEMKVVEIVVNDILCSSPGDPDPGNAGGDVPGSGPLG